MSSTPMPRSTAPRPTTPAEIKWAARLSGQLETLSELAENLTYRVLELEDRLAGQDRQLTSLRTASEELATGLGAAVEERMRETDARLEHLEELLNGQGKRPTAAARSLRALPNLPPKGQEAEALMEELQEQVLFLDEMEQEEEEPFAEEEATFAEESFIEEHPLDQSVAS